MEAKQIILTKRDVKLLADTIETPKVKGWRRDDQPIQEGIGTDTGRKILQARRELLKAIQDYLDEQDGIVETANADLREYADDEDTTEEQKALNQKERNRIAKEGQAKLNALDKGSARQEVAVEITDTMLKFLRDRFDNREDLQVHGELLERVVAISDALKEENVKTVEVKAVPAGDDRNGKPALGLVKSGVPETP